MIAPILIVSFILIAIGFIVNEENADQLLSGYNSMSTEDKENFDIQSYVRYFRKFNVFLGTSLLVISLGVYFFVNKDWSGVFLGTYPILAYIYFIWKGNDFFKKRNRKYQLLSYVWMGVLAVLLLLIVFEIKSSFDDNDIIVHHNSVEITGEYGLVINKKEIKSIELTNQLPKIVSKINGYALESIKKGYFRTNKDQKVTLLINSNSTPIIVFTTKSNYKIYYSSKNKSNLQLFKTLNSGVNRQ